MSNNKENRSSSNEVNFVIKKHLGVLSQNQTGWTKEVNIVSWNDRPAKLDIRDWNPEHSKMSKGIGLNGTEVALFKEILINLDIAEVKI